VRLADDPTPAAPLRDLQADVERTTDAVQLELALLAEVHERAVRRAATSTTEAPCPGTPSGP
jgi:hypothetical protein